MMSFSFLPTTRHLTGRFASSSSRISTCPRRKFSTTMPALLRQSHAAASGPGVKKKILLMDEIALAKQEIKDLSSRYEVIPLSSSTRSEFMSDCSTKYVDIDGMYRHFKGPATKVTGLFDAELVRALPDQLKFIVHNGAGYDQIDIDACTASGIQVSNVPTAVDGATADTALFLLLGSLRQFGIAQKSLYSGSFNSNLPLSHDPAGKLVGIVGMGGIGRAFAKRCLALGMDVQYHNRNRLSPELEGQATYVASLEELLKTSDVVSLNLPLNAKTRHTIGKEQLKTMKPSAVLINTARGGVIDEAALVEALEERQIAGVGLDVFEHEPKVSEGLLKSDKAFLLPHVGTLSVETQQEMEAVCLRNLDQGLKTGKLGFTVPEQKGRF